MLQVLGLGTHDEEVYLAVVARSGRAAGLPTPAVERLVTAGLLVPDRQQPGHYLTADLLALLERTLGGHAERPPVRTDGRFGRTAQISRPQPVDAPHRHPAGSRPPRTVQPGTAPTPSEPAGPAQPPAADRPPPGAPATGHQATAQRPTAQPPSGQPLSGQPLSGQPGITPQSASSGTNRPPGARPSAAPRRAAAPLGHETAAPSPRPTPAERELVALLADGLTDEVIARRLGVSYRTVQRRVHGLLQRLEARTRFQAGVAAARHSWI